LGHLFFYPFGDKLTIIPIQGTVEKVQIPLPLTPSLKGRGMVNPLTPSLKGRGMGGGSIKGFFDNPFKGLI